MFGLHVDGGGSRRCLEEAAGGGRNKTQEFAEGG